MNSGRTVHFLRFVLVMAFLLTLPPALHAQGPRGIEMRLNRTAAGNQGSPSVATAPGKGFVAAWQDSAPGRSSTITVRLFNATGAARTGEIGIGTGFLPAVAMGADGRFVVTWETVSTVTKKTIVVGRRYAADGTPLGPRFRLEAGSQRYQSTPDVAATADGGFVAVWAEEDDPNSEVATTDIYARLFAADGTPRGPEFAAMAFLEEQSAPRVATAADGSFVVVCQSYGGEPTFYDIFARLFAADGAPAGDPFQVNGDPSTSPTSQFGPDVARSADGRFAVTWTDRGGDPTNGSASQFLLDGTGVRVRFFAADGTPQGPESRVNTFTHGIQWRPAVAAAGNSSFLVAWESGGDQDGDKEGIFARVFAPDGTPRGREFRINLGRAGSQIAPAAALAADGRGVAAWMTPDGDGFGIDARLLGPAGGN